MYVIKVTIAQSDTYEEISGTKTFTISKAVPNYTIPSSFGILAGEKLSAIDLSNYNLVWDEPDTIVNQSGVYYATYIPTDSINYEMIEGVAINVDVVLSFVDNPTVVNTSFDYDGNMHSPTLYYDESQITTRGVFSASEVGTYTITFTRNDSTNTAWSDGSTDEINTTWEIKAINVNAPTLNTSFEYDGETKTIISDDIKGYDESTMQIISKSSTLSASGAGTYSVVIGLKDSTNYVWSDGSTSNKVLTWEIVNNSYDFEINLSNESDGGTVNAYDVLQDENTLEYIIKFNSISADTVYSITGNLNGYVVIDVGDDYKFELELNGVNIQSSYSTPIQILSGDKVQITAKKNTNNTIKDNREVITSDDSQYSSAIYSVVDLVLGGKGTLNVVSLNNNGIHTKDDLEIKNLTLNVDCKDNALKGNDSVAVNSGTLTLIARQGDGIKTSNSDISSKGNQKGIITLNGGTITIYSACDGIDSAYDVVIEDGVTLNVYTDKYSSYSEEVTAVTSSVYYIKTTSSNYKYSIKYNTSNGTTWSNATYYTSTRSGGPNGKTYYYYKVDKPSNATSFEVYAYSSLQVQGQNTSYVAVSSSKTVSSSYDTIVTSVSSNSISTSWSNYTTQQGPNGMGGMNEGNTDKGDYSTKGIKADNQITINGGTIYVQAYDDALHANNDETLENGSTAFGNITIAGGTLTLYSNDDAVHADGTLLISGGNVTITNAYEGLEGYIIKITNGTVTIKATDDGVNTQSSLLISGGRIDVTVSASGDSDGIDSNGSITITGGVVITRGPNNQNMSPLDADGSIKISGGTVIIIGYCPNLTTTLTKTQSSNGLSSGVHTVNVGGTTISYTNASSYSGKTSVFSSGTASVS